MPPSLIKKALAPFILSQSLPGQNDRLMQLTLQFCFGQGFGPIGGHADAAAFHVQQPHRLFFLSGAQNEYEMDYWFTSSREAMEYINRVAPENAVVGYYNHHLGQVTPFARPDLQIVTTGVNGRITGAEPDFAVICLRGKHYQNIAPVTDILWTVERDGVPLAMVLKY